MVNWLPAKRQFFWVLTVFLLFFWASATSRATDVTIAQVRESLKNRIAEAGRGLSAMAMIPLAYRGRQFEPFWFDSHLGIDSALAMVEAVGRAGEDGLSPMDYHWLAIQRLMAHIGPRSLNAPTPVPEEYAELDLLLTDAFLLLSDHLTFGKVNPETLTANWRVDPGRASFLPLLAQAASRGDVAGALDTLRTPCQEYKTLRAALASLRKTVAKTNGWPELKTEGLLREGDFSDAIDRLRYRLVVGGDLDGSSMAVDPCFFDSSLSVAIRHFQRRHGLSPDGIVGSDTIDMLNVPIKEPASARCNSILNAGAGCPAKRSPAPSWSISPDFL